MKWNLPIPGAHEASSKRGLIEMVDHLCRRLNLGGAFHDEVW